MHLVHFPDKFSSTSQPRLQRNYLQYAPHAVSTQFHLISSSNSPLLVSSDWWIWTWNQVDLRQSLWSFPPLPSKSSSTTPFLCTLSWPALLHSCQRWFIFLFTFIFSKFQLILYWALEENENFHGRILEKTSGESQNAALKKSFRWSIC